MKQVRAILEFRYRHVPEVFAQKQKLLASLSGDQLSSQAFPQENLNFKIEQENAHVSIDANRTVFVIEAERKASEKFFLAIFEKLNETMNYNHLDQVGYRCIYAQESDKDYESLVNQYKDAYFKGNELVSMATDVAVPLTYSIGDYHVNFQTGPMTGEELSSKLEFAGVDFGTLRFLDIDFVKKNVKISSRALKQHLADVHRLRLDLIHKWQNCMEAQDE